MILHNVIIIFCFALHLCTKYVVVYQYYQLMLFFVVEFVLLLFHKLHLYYISTVFSIILNNILVSCCISFKDLQWFSLKYNIWMSQIYLIYLIYPYWYLIVFKKMFLFYFISGGPLSALTCCVNVRLLSGDKKNIAVNLFSKLGWELGLYYASYDDFHPDILARMYT